MLPSITKSLLDLNEKADHFSRYYGFDDNGDGVENDWLGFSFNKHWVNPVGTSSGRVTTILPNNR
jgi:hypothetical protein